MNLTTHTAVLQLAHHRQSTLTAAVVLHILTCPVYCCYFTT